MSQRNNIYRKRNIDLLVDGISEITYEFIIDTLDGIKGVRNGYFHKDNLEEWDKVTEARNTASRIFYLFMGAYKLSDDDKNLLGMIRVNDHDDYYKLCEYINCKNNNRIITSFKLPVFYIDNLNDPYDFVFSHQDEFIRYDNYGNPIYSGLYFQKRDNRNDIMKYTKDNLPKELWEGSLEIIRNIPAVAGEIEITLTGAVKPVFIKGKFVVEDE